MAQILEAPCYSLPCPRCSLPLRGDESRCPACGKRVFFPEWLLAAVLIGIVCMAGLGILAAGQLKNMAGRSTANLNEAYDAARQFVLNQPGVKGPAVFAPVKDSLLEQWSERRWRIAGRAEARDDSNATVQILYTCVLERDGDRWVLVDITVQLLK